MHLKRDNLIILHKNALFFNALWLFLVLFCWLVETAGLHKMFHRFNKLVIIYLALVVDSTVTVIFLLGEFAQYRMSSLPPAYVNNDG